MKNKESYFKCVCVTHLSPINRLTSLVNLVPQDNKSSNSWMPNSNRKIEKDNILLETDKDIKKSSFTYICLYSSFISNLEVLGEQFKFLVQFPLFFKSLILKQNWQLQVMIRSNFYSIYLLFLYIYVYVYIYILHQILSSTI